MTLRALGRTKSGHIVHLSTKKNDYSPRQKAQRQRYAKSLR